MTDCYAPIFDHNYPGMLAISLLLWKINESEHYPLLKHKAKSDAVLLDALEFQKLQSGDQAVFKKVYDAYFGLAIFVVKRCGMNHEEALDIVQDSFIKLFQKANQIKSRETLKSWLMTIARNQAMDYRRKQKLVKKHAESERLNQRQSDEWITGLINDEQLHEMQILVLGELIDDIQEKTKDATFSLFYREGLSIKEIAKHQNEPISTITNRLSRLRKRFREKFEAHLDKLNNSVY